MVRWLLLPLGLAAAAAAAWLLLAAPGVEAPSEAGGAAARATKHPPGPGRPMSEIDAASRRRLEQVLEREGAGR